jgi:hypothetical protein
MRSESFWIILGELIIYCAWICTHNLHEHGAGDTLLNAFKQRKHESLLTLNSSRFSNQLDLRRVYVLIITLRLCQRIFIKTNSTRLVPNSDKRKFAMLWRESLWEKTNSSLTEFSWCAMFYYKYLIKNVNFIFETFLLVMVSPRLFFLTVSVV